MIACSSTTSVLQVSYQVCSRAGEAFEWLQRRWFAAGSQRKQKHKTTCCGTSLLCFTLSNRRCCFALLQESISGWFGAPPWRTRKYFMGVHILNIPFLNAFKKIAKSDCWFRHISLSVLASAWYNSIPSGRIFHEIWCSSVFRKICQANWSFNKIWHEQPLLYMNTYVQFWSYRPKFSLWWKMVQTNVVEKVNT
jgi:hypothetical protein